MDTGHFEPDARLPALHDTPCDSSAGSGYTALRAEAIRQLRCQLGAWACVPAVHPTGTPCLVAASERAKLHASLDLLRRAGEEVPSWLYRTEPLVRTTDAAGGISAKVSLVSLLADITRVLAWFDAAPGPLGADATVAGDDARARVLV
jgi:hypothetical protein